ncbi:alpha/beta fold hydrolase [Streptomyces sp. TG1A-8]|uniref:thioesterase II family protein n=1 Tax=Streptomyces sp. TG1A-8 TaxID=3051385 RepID=UPI00265C2FD9|nr:alpha/beta fold hydrolase [Streptomyces sp. TG1A-8]MDO0923997.1 alpha/beta fold hydrolase [Streptomyces sp. TG1A-8]
MTVTSPHVPLSDPGAWLRRFRPAPDAAVQLVCFPHAGGAASYYMPVAAALAPRIDVVAVQYPGRQDRRHEPFVEDIGVLADHIHAALVTCADRPMAFFGHSMGAVTAFEVAMRLERSHGTGPVRLFVSGRRAPGTRRQEAVHLRTDEGILAELRALSGTNEQLLQDDEMVQMIMPAIRADYRAIESYRGSEGDVVRCPVTVLVGTEDPQVTPDEARLWSSHTTGPFDYREFSGGHFYLADHQKEINALLTERLLGAAW